MKGGLNLDQRRIERKNDGRGKRRERWGRVEGHEPQSKGSEVRQLPEWNGHAELTYLEDPLPYIERKLLTVNTGHSAIAYLGYVRGEATIHTALEDDDIRDVTSKALEETSLLLAYEYGFDPEELREYRQKVLTRFENPRISDEVTRVARAPIRKLGHDERFVSPALRLFEMGHTPTHLAVVIRAVLAFDYPQDEEAVELQESIHAEGERLALVRYASLEEDHPLVDLVVERTDGI